MSDEELIYDFSDSERGQKCKCSKTSGTDCKLSSSVIPYDPCYVVIPNAKVQTY